MRVFDNLSREEKAYLLKENGVLIDSIKTFEANILLYSLNKEFVEVCCEPATNTILRIKIASEKDLSKYLHRITLSL
jgi:hypothetical protein